jgi:hypothetical protein
VGGNHIFERENLREKEEGFRHTMGFRYRKLKKGRHTPSATRGKKNRFVI